jgi:predicted transcriptional regulator
MFHAKPLLLSFFPASNEIKICLSNQNALFLQQQLPDMQPSFFSSQERAMSKSLVEMTAEIIQSQISSKQMTTEEIKAALNDTFQTLKALQDSELVGTEPEPEEANPVIDPKKSIQKNKIVCLECGQEFKMLSPKHLKSHSLTSKEYRKKHGFSARQPLCAKALSEKRSQSGKERGLPDNLRKAIEMRTKDKGKKK